MTAGVLDLLLHVVSGKLACHAASDKLRCALMRQRKGTGRLDVTGNRLPPRPKKGLARPPWEPLAWETR